MTERARMIFEFLKTVYPNPMTKQEIVAEMDNPDISVNSVTGTVRGLVNKGRAVESFEKQEIDGKVKELRYVVLTPAGMEFDPEQEALEKAAAKAAEKEAKLAAKLAAKEQE